ncbi:RNA 2',3'-cyclic phosphodiesterase [Oceanobacillus saliphilus]|uniref:RNA 2',3'-cyclic phosphodiesterase n=1 Tax=Oceanobacillus saliphilus TaxID=2925834 RepID=UPI00201E29E8|nr:RNA 2',3'-cyclic phosphodiesterase [Oceanobacillus saliphilus]
MSHYFIAIHVPEELQALFSDWQHGLKEQFPYKQWPHNQDLHITLKFLGDVADNKVEQLKQELQKVQDLQAFDLDVGGIGTFGNPNKPRVLWAGVERTDRLVKLQQIVEDCALKIGYQKEEREYRPHITLAKMWAGKSSLSEETLPSLQKQFKDKQTMHVADIVLFRIHPTKSPKYEVVERYMLK